MLIEFKTYLFVLSIIFLLKNMIIDFSIRLFDENPKPLEYDNFTKIFLYLSVSYVITYLIFL